MTQNKTVTFGDLGVSVNLLKVLTTKKLITPTPIQEQCISIGFTGKDIVGIAQTGTGKTLAFGIPAIEQILKSNGKSKCIILLPTRELATQVNEVLSDLGRSFRIRTALLIGGASSYPQKLALKKNPDIIVATPGRMIDHIKQRNCDLRNINIVVLDEADRMLDIGFMPQIREILKSIPTERQTMLFSATIPTEIAELSAQYMKDPVKIEVSTSGTSAKNITQEAYIVSSAKKQDLLIKVVKETAGSILVFTRTKFRSKKISSLLREAGLTAIEMHSNRSLAQRRQALEGFKSGRYKILVATDVAARGLDVNNISLVINLDLPDASEDYVHRIGRTGRAGKTGKAISFIEPDQNFQLNNIEKLIQKKITILKGSEEFSGGSERRKSRSAFQVRRFSPSHTRSTRPARTKKSSWSKDKPEHKRHSVRPRSDRNRKPFNRNQNRTRKSS